MTRTECTENARASTARRHQPRASPVRARIRQYLQPSASFVSSNKPAPTSSVCPVVAKKCHSSNLNSNLTSARLQILSIMPRDGSASCPGIPAGQLALHPAIPVACPRQAARQSRATCASPCNSSRLPKTSCPALPGNLRSHVLA